MNEPANVKKGQEGSQSSELYQHYLRRMELCLDEGLLQKTDWTHNDSGFNNLKSDYYDIWKTHSGGHKKYSYFELYDRLFGSYRGRNCSMLEIGVYKGASMKTWQKFLGKGSRVVGIDIDSDCARFESPEDGRHVRIGDQSDRAFLNSVGHEFGPFDIILDDASHQTDHQIAAFNALFLGHLKPGGTYFIEDTNTSLWPRYRHGSGDIFSLIESLSIAAHFFYADHDYADYKREQHPKSFQTLLATKLIEEVRSLSPVSPFARQRLIAIRRSWIIDSLRGKTIARAHLWAGRGSYQAAEGLPPDRG